MEGEAVPAIKKYKPARVKLLVRVARLMTYCYILLMLAATALCGCRFFLYPYAGNVLPMLNTSFCKLTLYNLRYHLSKHGKNDEK